MLMISQQIVGAAIGSVLLAASAIVPLETSPLPYVPNTGITYSRPSYSVSTSAPNPNVNYLPRRLYPGTYGEFCGPTPEVEVKQGCAVHGWHGDAPKDRVDEACEFHDIAYCNCEDGLLARRRAPKEDFPLLASMTALRFATKPALERAAPVDKEYFDCINKADRQIITTGIQVRSEMQRSGCSTDPTLSWFCDLGQGTLGVFEKVNMDIFLRDLDFDDQNKQITLKELERKRQLDLQIELQRGKTLADAASSGPVQEDEQQMLQRLLEKL
jgi:hypothetical protein